MPQINEFWYYIISSKYEDLTIASLLDWTFSKESSKSIVLFIYILFSFNLIITYYIILYCKYTNIHKFKHDHITLQLVKPWKLK